MFWLLQWNAQYASFKLDRFKANEWAKLYKAQKKREDEVEKETKEFLEEE